MLIWPVQVLEFIKGSPTNQLLIEMIGLKLFMFLRDTIPERKAVTDKDRSCKKRLRYGERLLYPLK